MENNAILSALSARKSVRVFTPDPVTPDERAAILNAAFQAPTAGNQQLYTVLDITDPALKATLADLCDHQPFIAGAPLVLVFLADCRRWLNAYHAAGITDARKPGAGDLMLAVADTCIAAQNAVVAAESLGLGSCYIGDIMERYEEHRRLLGLPEWVFPACMLVMGYPTRQQRERKEAARFEQRFIVQENAYCRLEGTRLREMYRGHTGAQSFEDFLAAFCRRKYESDFSREMSRSVGQYLKDFQGEAEV